MTALVFSAAIGAALVAGIFFAFSTFVMKALGRIAPGSGIAAMQSINVVVLIPWFFLAFFGTGALCLVAIVAALVVGPDAARIPVIAGGLLYLIGCVAVTLAGNVPLNERLAKTDPHGADAARLWDLYLVRWTRWNHVRTAASLAAAATYAVAIAAA